jgi:GH15 family glucan-1,4-alpha-glucosidase
VEEYDSWDQAMPGNFPQVFSHVALINTALNLMPEESQKNAPSKPRKKITRH